jgi:translation initiation factor IF-3
VTVFFRGREIVHKDRGLKMLQRVIDELQEIAKVEQQPQFEGRTMSMLLTPVPKNK